MVFTYLKPHIPKSIFLVLDSANVELDFSIGRIVNTVQNAKKDTL